MPSLKPWFPSGKDGLLAMAGGVFLAGAYSPWEIWPLALVSLAPLVFLCLRVGPMKSWTCGFLFGLCQALAQMNWLTVVITEYGGLPWVLAIPIFSLLAIYLALYPAFFAAGLSFLTKSGLPVVFGAPCLWVGLEWLRGLAFTGFPWLPLANALAWQPVLAQTAEWWGTSGLSFALVLVNTLAAMLLGRFGEKKRLDGVGLAALMSGVILVVAGYVWGVARMEKVRTAMERAPAMMVSLVQGNASIADIQNPEKRMSVVRTHVHLTEKEAAKVDGRPWLVVWSESAGPFYFLSDARPTMAVLEAAKSMRAYLTLGTLGSVAREGGYSPTNRSFLVGPAGEPRGWYDKVHLVPFGEYVPLGNLLFFVRAIAALQHDFAPGARGHVLPAGPATLGPLVCYESIFEELARSQRQKGADLIINQTNDAWFGRTGASRQHMSHLVMRCLENRMSCARSANSGVSGFVEPDGRVHELTGLFIAETRTRKLPLVKMDTFFTRHGDLMGPAGLVLAMLALCWAAWWRSKKKELES